MATLTGKRVEIISESENFQQRKYRKQVKRIFLSLQIKETTQSIFVNALSSYKLNSQLFLVLTEYDRVVISLFVLTNMDDETIRHYVQRARNRGVANHLIQSVIESVIGGKFGGAFGQEINVWTELRSLPSLQKYLPSKGTKNDCESLLFRTYRKYWNASGIYRLQFTIKCPTTEIT